ncbi:MAG: AMP-binding protein [Myxococcota bacterium]|jgi:acetyl-CoA synthetase/medium-chain acyl-CoA synthetase|nr:acyl-CoA synthetase [Deltaproteobacteria bacterium]MCP4244138.1 acyl--CoA ligase [bacterium]MDP6076249.1 AMP-binding protein [Myxococcota bacterium]MDP6243722.1 AMP-binding protein [Myxococcota bacterium]MDP7074955.1 AMP-binding protein [Myxococcota bacterium]
MAELEAGLDRWRRAADEFRWEIPDPFNFGRDVVDQFPPEQPALLWRGGEGSERRLGFGEIAEQSNRVAHLLKNLGVGPGDAIIVMLPRIPEWHIVMVGALKAGTLVIPCSTILRPKDIAYRAEHSAAVAVVTTPDQAVLVDQVGAEAASLRHRLCVASPGAAPPDGWTDLATALASQAADSSASRETRAADPALVYYTSGTTGPPKAVLHAHGYTFAQRYTSEFWHGVRAGDRVWTTSDTGWAKAAYGVIFGPWSLGAEVVLLDARFDPRTELSLLEQLAPQVFCAPPTEFRMLVKENLSGLSVPQLRECVSAGEPLNPEVIRAWRDATGLTIRDGYGQTESILLVANYPGIPVRPGSMGLPMPGHRIEVIDAAGIPLPPGEVGDIAVHGSPPGLFREYWKDPAATEKTRRGEWYVTGDRATRDEAGYFWFVGRDDDVIISAGYRIGPFEVESALVEHSDVVEAAAVAAPDPDRGAIVKAFVVLRDGASPSDELAGELQEHVKRSTAPYKYPRAIEFVADLPKTVSGKIRRVELRARG